MRVLAINGSPRKNGNTAKLLEASLKGAADFGAEVELIHLYDYDFKGAIVVLLASAKIDLRLPCVRIPMD